MRRYLKPVYLKRFFIYCLGLFIMALGVSFSVISDLGVSPVNSIPKVLSEISPNLSMGTWTTIVFCSFILIQLLILGREFTPSRFLQILCSFLFGRFVDISNWLTSLIVPIPHLYALRLVYLVISMALVGFGILFYLEPELLPLPGEGVMLAVSGKYGFPLHRCKIGFDTAVVIIAAVLSLVCFHGLNGVREGTIISAFGVGKFLGIFTKLFKNKLNRYLSPNPTKPSRPEKNAPLIPVRLMKSSDMNVGELPVQQ